MTLAPEWALQAALHAHLSADAGVIAELGDPPRLYDEAPGGAAFPYLTYGRCETTNADAGETRLFEMRLSLHVWSRHEGKREAKAIVHAVREAAHEAKLTLAGGWRLVSLRCVYADLFRGADGRTRHGVVRLRAVVEGG